MLGKPFVSLYFCRGDLIYGESLVDRTEPPSFNFVFRVLFSLDNPPASQYPDEVCQFQEGAL